jgi:hypothetical protein
MRSGTDAAAIVRALVASLPEDRLRGLLVALVLEGLMPPTSITEPRRRRGRPPTAAAAANGRRRKAANGRLRGAVKAVTEAKPVARKRGRRALREARPAPEPAGETAGNGNGAVAITPEALWRHAERIEPQAPWRAIMREFDVPAAAAQQAYRSLSLPRQVGPMAVTKFLALPAG